jgi:hypothetical protein
MTPGDTARDSRAPLSLCQSDGWTELGFKGGGAGVPDRDCSYETGFTGGHASTAITDESVGLSVFIATPYAMMYRCRVVPGFVRLRCLAHGRRAPGAPLREMQTGDRYGGHASAPI